MKSSLIKSKRFAPLFWTQSVSWFIDSFLKNVIVMTILFKVADGSAQLVSLAGSVYILPFLLLSGLGGQIADRCSKSAVIRAMKMIEILGAFLAIAGILMNSVPILFISLTLFGVISALFVPVQYSILPDLLVSEEVTPANAWLKGGGFFAKIAGTIGAGLLFSLESSSFAFAPVMLTLTIGCYALSRAIPVTRPAVPSLRIDWNILRSTWSIFSDLFHNRTLAVVATMTSWFWLSTALVLSILPVAIKENLGGNESAITFFMVVYAVAVSIGSAMAVRVCVKRITLGPSVLATVVMGLACVDLGFALSTVASTKTLPQLSGFLAQPGMARIVLDVLVLATAGAILVVPTSAALQTWSSPERRARTIAGASAIGAALIFVGGSALAAAQKLGLSTSNAMYAVAGLNLAASVAMYFSVFRAEGRASAKIPRVDAL